MASLEGEKRPQRAAAQGNVPPVLAHMRHANPLVVREGPATTCGTEHVGKGALTDVGGGCQEDSGKDLWRKFARKGERIDSMAEF